MMYTPVITKYTHFVMIDFNVQFLTFSLLIVHGRLEIPANFAAIAFVNNKQKKGM